MTANSTSDLRKRLRSKGIRLMVVKNSLARRAFEGKPLAPAFDGVDGTAAIMWGAEDFVSLVKEAVDLDKDEEAFEKFSARGGVMDGEQLDAASVAKVSKWPSRDEQLSMLVGQLLGPGSQLAAQLKGPGGQLAAQIKTIADKEE
jgi:ribosomal protein L10